MEATDRFVALTAVPEAALPLDEASLLIAAHAEPGLDVHAYLVRLDELAATCPAPTLDSLVTHLFRRGRFTGNRADYYDPRNSFLSDVIDRGTGIPITLSVLAMEVGRRLGVPLAGVGMPGHFLLRDKVDPGIFVDPFHGGRLLDEAACRRLHSSVVGPGATWDPAWLDPVGRWAIVARVLANLKAVYRQRGDDTDLLWVLRLRAMVPGAGDEDEQELRRLLSRFN
jgi:regulator of sirC expression with transglutaminase-like and TPR domain